MAADKTILIVAANPSDTARLRLSEEVSKIQAGLNLSDGRDRFTVVSQGAVRPDDLRRALLRHKPNLVHFSGHGTGDRGLIFEDDAGKAKWVSGDALARLFSLCPSVECVLLNACYSQAQANSIGQHIDYVVGMNDALGDRAAIEFAVGFYDALGYGRSVPEAYEFGLSAIALEGIDEMATPILQIRAGLERAGLGIELQGQRKDQRKDQRIELKEPATETAASGASEGEEEYFELNSFELNLLDEKSLELEDPEGLVPLDSLFYVERSPIETDCYEAILRPGSLIRIKAPRQMGKTSLLVRTLDHARSQGFTTVRLSLQDADTRALDDLSEFLQWFCASVTEELDLEDQLADYWNRQIGSTEALN
jgi:hypothetical protein